MFFVSFTVVILLGYFFGSIPTGFLAGKSRGIDIRSQGSGNIGATNAVRVLGKKWGILVFLGDAAKGIAAVSFSMLAVEMLRSAFPHARLLSMDEAAILGAVCCVAGHSFPVWLRFKGGKGVATTAGVMIALSLPAVMIAAAVWVAVFYSTRFVSLASLAAAVALPVSVFFLPGGGFHAPLFWLNVAIGILVTWRHRANILRLIQGTELRFEKNK